MPGARVEGRAPYRGAEFELSALAITPDPAGPGGGGAGAVALLRRAWEAGVTTFDTVDTASPPAAESILARAFPRPDPRLVVITPRRGDRRAGVATPPRAGAGPAWERRSGADDAWRPHRLWEVEAAERPSEAANAHDGPPRPGSESMLRVRSGSRDGPWGPGPPPPVASGELSLLRRGLAPLMDRSGPPSWVARDPFAGGRLDGTRFQSVGSPLVSSRPVPVRDLSTEFAAVARFGFLALKRRRTLAQAALRYVALRSGVACICIPLPPVERWEEILGFAGSEPLSETELAQIDAGPTLSESDA